MAYRIIFQTKIFIRYIIFDFITQMTIETINCRTEEGQVKYISLFGYQKFTSMIKLYSTEKLVFKSYSRNV
ncbi:MAG: hypothetical protein HeimC3_39670 [Candidatus Heimdallarchaeota archaeon LC_3]|nr:MAG: hypothetical protein HeimC3_39670 [Candidatus Heimdallarchaeota archaeon LC_3]